MRNRLQLLRENEGKLKALVIAKQERCMDLEAQLNSLRALERYHSDSESEGVTQLKVKKTLLSSPYVANGRIITKLFF